MKFFSNQFPNITICGEHIEIKFVDGIYDTEDAKEIKVLTGAGFVGLKEDAPKPEVKPEVKTARTVKK